MAEKIHTPAGVARFVALLQPRQRKDKKGVNSGEPKYEITLIFDEDTDLRQMKKDAMAVGIEKFGPKFPEMVKKGKYNWPFTPNEDRVNDDDEPIVGFEESGTHVKFKSTSKPGLVDANAEPIMEKSEIYDGMTARVSCRPFAYENESKGVSYFLINVQKLDDGKRLSGDPSAEEDFATKGKKTKKHATKDTDMDDLL